MKRILLTTVFLAICLSMLMAQIPQAFNYQAVVRDQHGTIIADQNINLRVSLIYGDPAGETVYTETHPVTTNGMGLVNIEIGRGFNPTGNLSEINWAEGKYFVKIEMDEYGGSDFKPMGVAQLLSVPYALHAGTAESIEGETDGGGGSPAHNWILFGNSGTDPTEDKLGTTDATDLNIVTNDISRINITAEGKVNIEGSLEVGDSLTVIKSARLNTEGGQTNIHGPFTVNDLKPSLFSGTLEVDGVTKLNNTLNVFGVTNLYKSFNVNDSMPSLFTGSTTTEGFATFNNKVLINNTDSCKDITNGALYVAGGVGIGENLLVGGRANIGSLTLDKDLLIKGVTQSADTGTGSLVVRGGAGIVKRLNVGGHTNLDSTLNVYDDAFIVEKVPNNDYDYQIKANGQVTINANPGSGDKKEYEDFPLQVEGGEQGIAIKVNGSRSKDNYFVSFWDDEDGNGDPILQGRIEGITHTELLDDSDYKLELWLRQSDVLISGASLGITLGELVISGAEVLAAATSSTSCLGFGACITVPIVSLIFSTWANAFLVLANSGVAAYDYNRSIYDMEEFEKIKKKQCGVSYQSGAGDYAEWLPKKYSDEIFNEGDVVGIINGQVVKDWWNADKIMIVSSNPIVIGNMQQPKDEDNYVKIAFIGQVPAKIVGEVNPGDYILPSEIGNGFGRAVHPDDMQVRDYKKVAGVAWGIVSELNTGLNIVNVAVGINTHDFSNILCKQEEDLLLLSQEVKTQNSILADLVPGYAEALGLDKTDNSQNYSNKQNNLDQPNAGINVMDLGDFDNSFINLSDDQIELTISMAREQYNSMVNDAAQLNNVILDINSDTYLTDEGIYLMPIDRHPFWQKMESDPIYKKEIVLFIKSRMQKAFDKYKQNYQKFTDIVPNE